MARGELPVRDAGCRERREPDFQEQLYDHLKSTPWWAASAAGHAIGLLLLSAILGAGVARAAPAAPMVVGIVTTPPDIEEDLKPEVRATMPLEERTEIRPEELKVTVDVERDPLEAEPDEVIADSRFTGRGPFEGNGDVAHIGVGGGAGGFSGRSGGVRDLRMTSEGNVLLATDAGLEWLKNHQSPTGPWDCDGFEAMCRGNRCGGPGGPLYDPGVTGLALLAFLGTGETHTTRKYGSVVRGGLKYLKGIQDAEGCFGSRAGGHFTYNHAIAAMAMAEAYGLTQSILFKSSAQHGIDFIQQCQNPYMAWRYGVRPQDNDTSVTGWMVMALKSGRLAGLDVDPLSLDGARAWLDKVTEPEYGRAGYTARGNGPARPQELMDRFPADKSESMTAVAVLTRIFCNEKPTDDLVRKGADLCRKSLPVWDEAAGSIDFYYWYYGTLAMFQVGGDHWKDWNRSMKSAILDHQRMDPTDCRHGSWDPVDPWASEGGRVYSTAVNTLCLEVYYRYGRVVGTR